MRYLVLLLVLASACAGVRPLEPTVRPEKRIENVPLPPDPEVEKLEGDIPPDEWVEPLEEGLCIDAQGRVLPDAPKPCPARSGVSMSEAKAARFGLFKIRYIELRKLYVADRSVWTAHRELYEERLKLADQAIQDLQPTWWDRHKGEFGMIGGFVIGTVVTITIFSIAE
jgi:hypothetical protein